MKLVNIISQHRNDFQGVYECEFCEYTESDKSLDSYNDHNYYENVIPNKTCKKCKLSTISGKDTEGPYVVFARDSSGFTGMVYFKQTKDSVVGYHDPRLADVFTEKDETEKLISSFDYTGFLNIEPLKKHVKNFLKTSSQSVVKYERN